MEGAAWPALSESARAYSKSLADSSPSTVLDGSPSTSQDPVIPRSTQKKATGYDSSNATPNRTMSGRQRSSKRGGGGGNSSASGPPQGGFPHQHQHPPPAPPPPPPFPVVSMPLYGHGNFIPTTDLSRSDPQYGGNNWEPRPVGGFAPHLHNNHQPSSRRGGNYGPRGYHNNLRGRHDRDRGSYGNTREAHMYSQRAPPRGFPRLPPPSADAFLHPQPIMPFMNPIGYPDMIYYPTMPMEPIRGMQLFASGLHSPMIMPVPEPSLSTLLLHQIDYYFSDANLVKDEFLKSNMDDQGWVSISLIAGFPRVKSLTDNIQLILDSLQSSTVVEVLDNKVRRRNDWMNWISSRVSKDLGSPSPGQSSYDMIASSFQQITVAEESNDQSEAGNVNPFAKNHFRKTCI